MGWCWWLTTTKNIQEASETKASSTSGRNTLPPGWVTAGKLFSTDLPGNVRQPELLDAFKYPPLPQKQVLGEKQEAVESSAVKQINNSAVRTIGRCQLVTFLTCQSVCQ